MTDAAISAIFEGAGDFIRRELHCGQFTLYAYAIDGLVSSADASENIFRPLSVNLKGDTMEQLYQSALYGDVYHIRFCRSSFLCGRSAGKGMAGY